MLIIDRIEGNKAIVETPEGHVDVALGDIEGKARDGAVLTDKGSGKYAVDELRTKERSDKAASRTKSLFG